MLRGGRGGIVPLTLGPMKTLRIVFGVILLYVVEGVKIGSRDIPGFFIFLFICLAAVCGALVAGIVAAVTKDEKSSKWGFIITFWVVLVLLYLNLRNS